MDSKKFSWTQWLWNGWCILSIIGIWPRYLEPRWLETRKLSLKIPNLPKELTGLKILHLTDLHWGEESPTYVAKKTLQMAHKLKPDIIVFTGDLICRSKMVNNDRLHEWLNSFSAPLGCYAVLGNHDYNQFITINKEGNYDTNSSNRSSLKEGFRKFITPTPLVTGKKTSAASKVGLNNEVLEIFNRSPFYVLHNETKQIDVHGAKLNICGLGEYQTGHFDIEKSFSKYDKSNLGLVLVHNPDAVVQLSQMPGELILSGHTHGSQVNLPWIWKKFMRGENPQWKRGLIEVNNKKVYICRGIGSIMKFRWFSRPQITLITLERGKNG